MEVVSTEKFLGRILPDHGEYYSCIGIPEKKQFLQSKPVKDKQTFITTIGFAKGHKNYHTYYATASFNGNGRTKEGVLSKRAFYLDIDCDKFNVVPYRQVEILDKICKRTGLPRFNCIVDSGGGLHVYWILDKDLSEKQWTLLATGLKKLTNQYPELKADTAITADSARVLRVPGTYNPKYDPPRKVEIVFWDDNPVKVKDIITVLHNLHLLAATQPSTSTKVTGENLDLTEGVYTDYEYDAIPIFKQCGVMRDILVDKGAHCDEPLWKDTLHLLAFTKNGAKFKGPISCGHRGYSKNQTNVKFKQRLAAKDKVGPTLCSTFQAHSLTNPHYNLAARCNQCPHKGKIKTPLVLGIDEPEPEPEEVETETGIKLPRGYKQNAKGIYHKVQGKYKLIWPQFQIVDLTPTLTHDGIHTANIVLRKDDDKLYEVEPSLVEMNESKSFFGALAQSGVVTTPKYKREVLDFMSEFYNAMENVKGKTRTDNRMGWVECKGKQQAFNLTGYQYLPDGNHINMTLRDNHLQGLYEPKGDFTIWKDAADYLLNQDVPQVDAVLATAFASPLVKFTEMYGAILAIVSEKSGTGKTTSLRCAQAVWGDPVRGINALDDTYNSVTRKLGMTRHLPAYWDEVRAAADVTGVIKTLFSIAQGREKGRLTQQIEVRESGTWNTMMCVASNESLLDHVDHIIKGTDAGRLRMLELTMPPLAHPEQQAIAQEKFSLLKNNYGHAGVKYAQWLVRNQLHIQKRIADIKARLAKDVKAKPDHRFWVDMATTLIAGAEFAEAAKIITFNKQALYKLLVRTIDESKDSAQKARPDDATSAMDALINYYRTFKDYSAVIERASQRGVPQGLIVEPPVKQPVRVAIYQKDKTIRIDKVHFSEWLIEDASLSPSVIIGKLMQEHSAKESRTVICADAGFNARIRVIDVPIKGSYIKSILD